MASVPTYGSRTKDAFINHTNCTKKKYDRQLPSDDFPTNQSSFASEISIDISSATMTHSEESQGLARFHVPVGGAGSTRDGWPRQCGLSLQLRG